MKFCDFISYLLFLFSFSLSLCRFGKRWWFDQLLCIYLFDDDDDLLGFSWSQQLSFSVLNCGCVLSKIPHTHTQFLSSIHLEESFVIYWNNNNNTARYNSFSSHCLLYFIWSMASILLSGFYLWKPSNLLQSFKIDRKLNIKTFLSHIQNTKHTQLIRCIVSNIYIQTQKNVYTIWYSVFVSTKI